MNYDPLKTLFDNEFHQLEAFCYRPLHRFFRSQAVQLSQFYIDSIFGHLADFYNKMQKWTEYRHDLGRFVFLYGLQLHDALSRGVGRSAGIARQIFGRCSCL
jgi:hypothetical protein